MPQRQTNGEDDMMVARADVSSVGWKGKKGSKQEEKGMQEGLVRRLCRWDLG